MRGRIQSKSIDSSAAANSAPMSTFSGDEHAGRLLADRVVDRGREVQPAEVAVAVVADVADVVLARHFAAERRRPLDEAVLVVVRVFVLAIAVVGQRHLRGEAEHREVLPVQVGDEHVVVAQRSARGRSGRCSCPSRGGGSTRCCTASDCCRACRTGARRAGCPGTGSRGSPTRTAGCRRGGCRSRSCRRRCAGACRRTPPGCRR